MLIVIAGDKRSYDPNLQVVIMHALHVCPQHSLGLPLRMNGIHRNILMMRKEMICLYEWVLQISVETIQIRTDLSARRQNMPGWLDVLITLQSTPTPVEHQSEAVFVDRHRFSKLSVCEQEFPSFPSSPFIPLFWFCPNFLDETLATQAKIKP